MTTPDDHVPAAGCNWNTCGLGTPASCPLVKDAPQDSRDYMPSIMQDGLEGCLHEWRQVIVSDVQLETRFFCIHCLTMTGKQL